MPSCASLPFREASAAALRTLLASTYRVRNSPAYEGRKTCRTKLTRKQPSITNPQRSRTAPPPSSTARTSMARAKSTRPRLSSTPRSHATIPTRHTRSRARTSSRHGRPGHTPACRATLNYSPTAFVSWFFLSQNNVMVSYLQRPTLGHTAVSASSYLTSMSKLRAPLPWGNTIFTCSPSHSASFPMMSAPQG